MNVMYSNQELLPKLPVPDLQTTVSEFLKWVQPIVSESEFQECQQKAEAFVNAEGKVLQDKLKNWDKGMQGSWLKPFWDASYLEYREPVVPCVNYFAWIEKKGLELYNYAELAGHMIYQAARIHLNMAEESMAPESIKGTPLCMDQYRRTVCTTRVPERISDRIETSQLTKNGNHIVLLYRGNFYKVMISNADGLLYTPEAIADLVAELTSSGVSEGAGVGVFTTALRDDAAELYKALQSEPINKASLRVVEESILVVCIDDNRDTDAEIVQNLMISEGHNRYYDKGCQIIINKNGQIGFNNEHTGADGTTWFTLFEKMHDGAVKGIREDSHALPMDLCASELKWELSEPILQRLSKMKQKHQQNEEAYYVDADIFCDFGKHEIKSLKVSPDAFFHVALQMAQYKLFGQLNSTYEPVAVRYFAQGRTECNRPCTSEVLELSRTFAEGSASSEELKALAQKACDAHIRRIQSCQKGHGVERHLLGLQLMQAHFGPEINVHEMPELFGTAAYKKLKYDRISTSGLGYEYVRAFGFGPQTKDGFGIGYGIRDKSITTCASCRSEYREDLEKLMTFFYEMLNSLRTILAEEL